MVLKKTLQDFPNALEKRTKQVLQGCQQQILMDSRQLSRRDVEKIAMAYKKRVSTNRNVEISGILDWSLSFLPKSGFQVPRWRPPSSASSLRPIFTIESKQKGRVLTKKGKYWSEFDIPVVITQILNPILWKMEKSRNRKVLTETSHPDQGVQKMLLPGTFPGWIFFLFYMLP